MVGATRSFGDVVLLGDGADTAGAARTPVGGLRQPEGGRLFERIFLGRRIAGKMPDLQVGDRIDSPLTGIVDYGFSNYRVQLLEPLTLRQPRGRGRRAAKRTQLTGAPGDLTLATFNVENLSIARDAPRIARLGQALVEALGAPAIVALRGDPGRQWPGRRRRGHGAGDTRRRSSRRSSPPAVRATRRWRSIPRTTATAVSPGGNIRVALLYEPARVEFVARGAARPHDPVEIVGRGRTMGL